MQVALTIAGSDSGGGAGIQADLLAFAQFGIWGTSAITCVTAQNPAVITQVAPLAPDLVQEQIAVVCQAFGVGAIKVGMTYSAGIIRAVATSLRRWAPDIPVVLDPVMRATSGRALLQSDAETALVTELLPLATVVTPNLAEAAVLAGVGRINDVAAMQEAAERIGAQSGKAVIITGGHLDEAPVDLVWADGKAICLTDERIETSDSHGTGCAFSAAVAAGLARDQALVAAAEGAKTYVRQLLQAPPAAVV